MSEETKPNCWNCDTQLSGLENRNGNLLICLGCGATTNKDDLTPAIPKNIELEDCQQCHETVVVPRARCSHCNARMNMSPRDIYALQEIQNVHNDICQHAPHDPAPQRQHKPLEAVDQQRKTYTVKLLRMLDNLKAEIEA